MAGRKQHFIPQALQKGFRIVDNGKKAQVYVFKKGGAHYLAATDGVAAQRDFYSAPSDEETLDDKITTYEGMVLAPAIMAFRDSPVGPVDSETAAAVVVHLAIRTAFTRDGLSSVALELLGALVNAMRNDQEARVMLGVDSLKPDSMLLTQVQEELYSASVSLPDELRTAFVKFAHFRAREQFSNVFPDVVAAAMSHLGRLLENIPELAVGSHGQALRNDLVPAPRVARLKEMNWRVIEAGESNFFVLPDCIAVGLRKVCKTPTEANLHHHDSAIILT